MDQPRLGCVCKCHQDSNRVLRCCLQGLSGSDAWRRISGACEDGQLNPNNLLQAWAMATSEDELIPACMRRHRTRKEKHR